MQEKTSTQSTILTLPPDLCVNTSVASIPVTASTGKMADTCRCVEFNPVTGVRTQRQGCRLPPGTNCRPTALGNSFCRACVEHGCITSMPVDYYTAADNEFICECLGPDGVGPSCPRARQGDRRLCGYCSVSRSCFLRPVDVKLFWPVLKYICRITVLPNAVTAINPLRATPTHLVRSTHIWKLGVRI